MRQPCAKSGLWEKGTLIALEALQRPSIDDLNNLNAGGAGKGETKLLLSKRQTPHCKVY